MEEIGVPELFLSQKERDFYQFIFNQYNTETPEGKIMKSDSVRNLFLSANLPNKDLVQIWSMVAVQENKFLEETSFFKALKLVAIKQNYHSFEQYHNYFKTEIALPQFDKEEIQMFEKKNEKMLDKNSDDLLAEISDVAYVEDGYFGWKSYHLYKIEVTSKLPGYEARKKYIVYRRFRDFDWLNLKLMTSEKYKGYVLPPLPDKRIVGKTGQQFVEKRRNELEVYLQMICRHSILKYDPTLRFFLTCENSQEFDRYKSDPSNYFDFGDYSKSIGAIKKLRFTDAYNYISSSIKHNYFDNSEPPEFQIPSCINLDEVVTKIDSYMPVLEKMYSTIDEDFQYIKNLKTKYDEISQGFHHITDDDSSFEQVLKTSGELFNNYQPLLEEMNSNNHKLKAHLKEEILKLRGIKNAISERKTSIKNFNTVCTYHRIKTDKLKDENSVANAQLNEEIEGLEEELRKLTEQINNINKNLKMELDSFTQTRGEYLKEIMVMFMEGHTQNSIKIKLFLDGKLKEFSTLVFERSFGLINPTIQINHDEEEEENLEETKFDDF